VTTDHELSGDHGDQLALDGFLPAAGETYLDNRSSIIATVVSVVTDRRTWVTIRRMGSDTTIPLEWFQRDYTRCRGDGSLV